MKNVQGTIHMWGSSCVEGTFTRIKNVQGAIQLWRNIHRAILVWGKLMYVKNMQGLFTCVQKLCGKRCVNNVCKNVCRKCVKNMCKNGYKNVCENVQRTILVWEKITCGDTSHQSEILHSFIFKVFLNLTFTNHSQTSERGFIRDFHNRQI